MLNLLTSLTFFPFSLFISYSHSGRLMLHVKKGGETVITFLLHCEIANALWNSILCLFGLKWVMSRQVMDLFACWRGQFDSFQSVAVWKMISPCLMWCIRRERNYRNFEDYAWMMVELKAFFKTLYQWTVAYDCLHISSFLKFLDLFSFSC